MKTYGDAWDLDRPADYIRIPGTFVGKVVDVARHVMAPVEGKPSVAVWNAVFRVGRLQARGSFWEQERSLFWIVNLFRSAGLTQEDVSCSPAEAWMGLIAKGNPVVFSTQKQRASDFFEVDVRSIRPVGDQVDMSLCEADYQRALAALGVDDDDCPF